MLDYGTYVCFCSVFNVVVDSLETGQRLATVMTANSSRYPGQMTCLPLNNMRPKQLKYPDSDVWW